MRALTSYAFHGFEGTLVRVEVDIRRGIPGIDIVGLPDSAVRESRERVRVGVRNAGFRFPSDRVLINLAPADLRKGGAAFDLPIAAAILTEAGAASGGDGFDLEHRLLLLGEIDLSGAVRPVRGTLGAVALGLRMGITHFIVPAENLPEALALGRGRVCGVGSIGDTLAEIDSLGRYGRFSGTHETRQAPKREAISVGNSRGRPPAVRVGKREPSGFMRGDFADLRGAETLIRAVTIAATGRHHLLLYGPPGSGKTMAAVRLPTILPDLDWKTAVEATRVHSIAGLTGDSQGLIVAPPFRSPHHSASVEGLIGGGSSLSPGEVSLAHGGVLFLDEAAEFRPTILQALREPIETKRVSLSRAGRQCWFPADFQLVLATNGCPCGNLGRDDEACLCSRREVQLYWKRLGGALLDRIGIRCRVSPPSSDALLRGVKVSSAQIKRRVVAARGFRCARGDTHGSDSIPPQQSRLTQQALRALERASRDRSMSARAHLAVLEVARTIADLEEHERIEEADIEEAMELRSYGRGDFAWR